MAITLEDLVQIVEDQAKKIETLTEANTALQGKVAAQTISFEPAKLPVVPTDKVGCFGKEYMFQVASFRLPGNDMVLLSEEAILDDDIILGILSIEGQGILKEQA